MIPRFIKWVKANERKILLSVSFICIFILGFFAGRIQASHVQPVIKIEKSSINTSILKDNFQTNVSSGGGAAVLGSEATDCPVKGNASSKIYHVPGGSYYATLKSPTCFVTEADAQAAGYRKSQR